MILHRKVIRQLHNDIATVAAFSFLRAGGELMARGMDFQKPRLEEYMAPSSLCLSKRFRTVYATGYRSAQERA